jgi:excisionase family DNA binding protein
MVTVSTFMPVDRTIQLDDAPVPRSVADNFEPLLSPGQAASLLIIHPKTLVRMARSGEVPALRMGKHWRFCASLLNAYIADKVQSNRQPT